MSRSKEKKNYKYLLNNLFCGGYGGNSDNLPHEAINFVKSDNGKFYGFITPHGLFSKSYWNYFNDKNERKNFIVIYFRTTDIKDVLEILGYSKGINYFFVNDIYDKLKKNKNKKEVAEQVDEKERIDGDFKRRRAEIKFGGKSLRDIYKNDKNTNKVYATFEFEKTFLSKKPIFISNKRSLIKLNKEIKFFNSKKRIQNESMRRYILEGKESAFFDNLIKEEKWEEVKKFDKNKDYGEQYFLKAALQQDNEVIFTNLIYYFLSYDSNLLFEFIKETLKLKINNADLNHAKLYREKDKMDISIRIGNKEIIIIENKIKSYVNGIKNEKINGKNDSQLNKYIKKAKKEGFKKIHTFILHPDYELIDISKFYKGNKYKIIKYSQFLNFLLQNNKQIKDKQIKLYYDEFIRAVKKHTTPVDDDFRNDIMNRLRKRINS